MSACTALAVVVGADDVRPTRAFAVPRRVGEEGSARVQVEVVPEEGKVGRVLLVWVQAQKPARFKVKAMLSFFTIKL